MPQYNRKDHFYQKAKKEGYPSRSAYKLIEMDKQFGIFKSGVKIIDLGSAPGGWLKVCEEKLTKVETRDLASLHAGQSRPSTVDSRPIIIGIDLLPLKTSTSPSMIFIQGDFTDPENQQKIIETLGDKADWVLSDMSHNLSGIKFRDINASLDLCQSAFDFAKKILKKGGGLVVKTFPGPDTQPFKKDLEKSFQKIKTFIPESTRKTSTEIYLIAKGFM